MTMMKMTRMTTTTMMMMLMTMLTMLRTFTIEQERPQEERVISMKEATNTLFFHALTNTIHSEISRDHLALSSHLLLRRFVAVYDRSASLEAVVVCDWMQRRLVLTHTPSILSRTALPLPLPLRFCCLCNPPRPYASLFFSLPCFFSRKLQMTRNER